MKEKKKWEVRVEGKTFVETTLEVEAASMEEATKVALEQAYGMGAEDWDGFSVGDVTDIQAADPEEVE